MCVKMIYSTTTFLSECIPVSSGKSLTMQSQNYFCTNLKLQSPGLTEPTDTEWPMLEGRKRLEHQGTCVPVGPGLIHRGC